MRRFVAVFLSLLIISILLDLFLVVGEGHNGFPWSHLAGFFALFGFIGCLLIIIVAKLLGHHWLQRREDYYGDDDE
jgi:hypothetical protein